MPHERFRIIYAFPDPTPTVVLAGLFIGTISGILLGSVSGLVPGIHVNTMAGLLLSVHAILIDLIGAEAVAASLFAALVTHTFLDTIPSTFLGVPDPDTALSVLPAHALCLAGRGEEAVRLSALGGAGAVVLTAPLFWVSLAVLPLIQPAVDWGIGVLLVGVAGHLIVSAESPRWAAAIFAVSGLLGLFTFRYDFLGWHTLTGGGALLLPLLTGLFGLPALLQNRQGVFPEQREEIRIELEGRPILTSTLLGTAAGAMVGWLPGLSNATANALLADLGHGDAGRRFIVATGAANTANAFLGLAALYALSRTRNGVMVALASQDLPPAIHLLIAGTVAALCAYLLTVFLSRAGQWLARIHLRRLNLTLISFITILTFITTGPFGLLILILATATGTVPLLVNTRRIYGMGAIMLPVTLNAWGLRLW